MTLLGSAAASELARSASSSLLFLVPNNTRKKFFTHFKTCVIHDTVKTRTFEALLCSVRQSALFSEETHRIRRETEQPRHVVLIASHACARFLLRTRVGCTKGSAANSLSPRVRNSGEFRAVAPLRRTPRRAQRNPGHLG